MKKVEITGLAEDVMKVDHALVASLKGVRALATRLHQDSEDANEREQLEKIIATRVSVTRKMPVQPKRQPGPDPNLPLRKFRKIFAALSEEKLQFIMDLARSMAKQGRKEGPSPKDKAAVQGEKEAKPKNP